MAGDLIVWDAIEEREIIPGFHGKIAHSANMTFVLWAIDAGAVLPEHAHPHEQVIHIFDGELELTVEGSTRVASGGSVAVVPSYARHSARALTACRAMDAFHPLREDYMAGGSPIIAAAAAKA